jgi:pimeloyl-ACP methyl ester carboxylesterase/DNA-binding CsgD family transcriptional regulator
VTRSRGFTRGKARIAYEVIGSGPDTLVVIPPWVSHLDYDWQTPEIRAFYEALAQGRRVIRYDRRGSGLSDRVVTAEDCTPEVRMADCLAVLDAAGVARASLLGTSGGGAAAIAWAAARPERVAKLVLYGSYARLRAAADYPIGRSEERPRALISLVRSEWGLGSRVLANVFIPETDPAKVAWFTTYQRIAATAEVAVTYLEADYAIEVRHLLDKVACPVLVLHRRQEHMIPFSQGEYLAAHLPGARLQLLEGEHHIPYLGDSTALVDAVNRFLTSPGAPTRALSPREVEVLKLVADGLSNRDIAVRLGVGEATVTRHLANIFAKTATTGRAGAVAFGFRQGLI